ncbi:sigma factor [Flavobacterium sp. TMP13]|uniref:sigma factor n=1 Tax=Flavobacterium sp. TMP13 TaxID=3425950 RepID=UPI003D786933
MRQLKVTKKISDSEKEVELKNYLQEIENYSSLTDAEEVELIVLIKTGDQNAIEKLVKSNFSLVVSITKEYENQGLALWNLINEGNLALINSAKCFKVELGVSFRFYLEWSIRKYLSQAVAEQIVLLPIDPILGSMPKIGKKYALLEDTVQSQLSVEKIAEEKERKIKNEQDLFASYLNEYKKLPDNL